MLGAFIESFINMDNALSATILRGCAQLCSMAMNKHALCEGVVDELLNYLRGCENVNSNKLFKEHLEDY